MLDHTMDMDYRTLGRTGLKASVIGLGTEYLHGQSRETVISVVHEALQQGVNYFDIIFSFPEYLDNLGIALEGQRKRIFLAGHLGSSEKNGQYQKTRSVKKSKAVFLDLLSRLGTEAVDLLFLHNCDRQNDYDQLMHGGQFDLACALKQEGKARFLGFSGHTIATARQAVESGQIDVLMFPIHLAGNAVPGRQDLLNACIARDIGVVAMKPYAGGKLLLEKRSIQVGKTQMGGEALKLKASAPISPVHCLAYSLEQIGVSIALPGCADREQLFAALAYLEASDAEKDFSSVITDVRQYATGECVYCNHCLPCPSQIDVGKTLRLLDIARQHLTAELRAQYARLPASASACTACGACVERCPFGVDVIAKMTRAVQIFEAREP
ncbi:hypothetical protein GF339_23540 [candidate division KSB3 bacterium]|uniref:4Fe-4S ferredoxin-type domain-containing protein n=1 Tax=candidate division KSB3 bacterium TaxID=2044937 RepID=A0A9D5K0E8_9BACT|nr:hypothetical protein [candidate division KSB3 bacterium]MBD3327578.1 hypothetical protein [candidate division KSB3 bacterium]